MFITALIKTANNWKQLRCLVSKQLKQWYIHTLNTINNKKNKLVMYKAPRVNL